MINYVIWIAVGALVGWVASMLMGTNRRQGLIMDVIVGIVGALIAGWLLTPILGVSTINEGNFSLPGMGVSLAGAVILLWVVRLLRGKR